MCADVVKLCICAVSKPEVGHHHVTSARRATRGSRKQREEVVIEACRWLVAAGFPQYIQLLIEGQLELSDIETLAADHSFVDNDWLLPAESRLKLLLRSAGAKTNHLHSEQLKRVLTTGSSSALSRKWKRDRLSRRWQRCRSTPSSSNSSLLIARRQVDPARHTPLPANSPSPSLADPDTGNHVTSGYESETSPMSTAKDGVGGRTRDRCVSPRSDVSHAAENIQSRSTDLFSASSEDVRDFEDLKCRHGRSPDSGLQSDHVHVSADRQNSPRCENGSNGSSESAVMRRRKDCSSATVTSSSRLLPPPRSLSFYDNLSISEVLADPQAELELILDDLRRNISALDAALSSPCASTTSSQIIEKLDALDELSVITDEQPSLDAAQSNSTSQLLLVSESNAGTPSPSSVPHRHHEQTNGESSTSPPFNHVVANGHCDVSTRDTSSGYDWWVPGVTSRSGRGDEGHVTVLTLSACELSLVRQLSLLRVTSLLERHCESAVSDSIVSHLASMLLTSSERYSDPDTESGDVFGSSVTSRLRRSGRAVAPCITRALQYITASAADTDGLFRRPGVLSKVQALQQSMNYESALTSPSSAAERMEYDEDTDVYSLADVIKRYYRELPESVFTDRLATTLVDFFAYVPETYRLEICRDALLLLPDACRLAVYQLLTFLRHVALLSRQNQMTSHSLAVCFLPSLFRITDFQQRSPLIANSSSAATRAPTVTTDGHQLRYKAALSCLATLIANADFLIRLDDVTRLAVDEMNQPEMSASLNQRHLLTDSGDVWRAHSEPDITADYLQRMFDELSFYVADKDKSSSWVRESSEWTEVAVSRLADVEHESTLPLWRVSVDVEASPADVLARLRCPQTGNSLCTRWTSLAELAADTDLVEYTVMSPVLDRPRCFYVIRSWRCEPKTGRYLLVSASVRHQPSSLPSSAAVAVQSGTATEVSSDGELEALLIAGHYCIEPSTAGKSRLTHVSSIDFRGHSEDWYLAVFGRLCALHVLHIRDSFRRDDVTRSDVTGDVARTCRNKLSETII